MSARRRPARTAIAVVALVASLVAPSCAATVTGDRTIAPHAETGTMAARATRIASALPDSRADASVVRSGLARHFAVTVYTPIRPTAAALRATLAAVARMIPDGVSAVEFDARTPTRAPWELAREFAALGIPDAALREHGGGFTVWDLEWFRSAFGG